MCIDELEQLAFDVEEGKLDPVKAYIKIYEIEKIASDIRKTLQGSVIEKTTGTKEYVEGGYKVTTMTRTNWTYKDDEVERLKALLKNRQTLMQKAVHVNQMYDDNGELVPPAEAKYSTYVKLEVI